MSAYLLTSCNIGGNAQFHSKKICIYSINTSNVISISNVVNASNSMPPSIKRKRWIINGRNKAKNSKIKFKKIRRRFKKKEMYSNLPHMGEG